MLVVPPPLAALLARAERIAADNPAWQTDALLICADWMTASAIYLEIGGQRAASDAQHTMADLLRRAAAQLQIEAQRKALPPAPLEMAAC